MRLIQKLGDWFDLRLQLGAPIRRDRELVLCFRQRRAYVFHAPDCYRHIARNDLRAFCGRGVEQPPNPQS